MLTKNQKSRDREMERAFSEYVVTTFAGTTCLGCRDGDQQTCAFGRPVCIAYDPSHMAFFVVDKSLGMEIRVVMKTGTVHTLKWINNMSLLHPYACILIRNFLVISDSGHNRIVYIDISDYFAFSSQTNSYEFVPKAIGRLKALECRGLLSPTGLLQASATSLYIANTGNRCVQLIEFEYYISAETNSVSLCVRSIETVYAGELRRPQSICLVCNGERLLIADANRLFLHYVAERVTVQLHLDYRLINGYSREMLNSVAASFSSMVGVSSRSVRTNERVILPARSISGLAAFSLTNSDLVFVSDCETHLLYCVKLDWRSLSPFVTLGDRIQCFQLLSGRFTRGYRNGPLSRAELYCPSGILPLLLDQSLGVLICDSNNSCLRLLTPRLPRPELELRCRYDYDRRRLRTAVRGARGSAQLLEEHLNNYRDLSDCMIEFTVPDSQNIEAFLSVGNNLRAVQRSASVSKSLYRDAEDSVDETVDSTEVAEASDYNSATGVRARSTLVGGLPYNGGNADRIPTGCAATVQRRSDDKLASSIYGSLVNYSILEKDPSFRLENHRYKDAASDELKAIQTGMNDVEVVTYRDHHRRTMRQEGADAYSQKGSEAIRDEHRAKSAREIDDAGHKSQGETSSLSSDPRNDDIVITGPPPPMMQRTERIISNGPTSDSVSAAEGMHVLSIDPASGTLTSTSVVVEPSGISKPRQVSSNRNAYILDDRRGLEVNHIVISPKHVSICESDRPKNWQVGKLATRREQFRLCSDSVITEADRDVLHISTSERLKGCSAAKGSLDTRTISVEPGASQNSSINRILSLSCDPDNEPLQMPGNSRAFGSPASNAEDGMQVLTLTQTLVEKTLGKGQQCYTVSSLVRLLFEHYRMREEDKMFVAFLREDSLPRALQMGDALVTHLFDKYRDLVSIKLLLGLSISCCADFDDASRKIESALQDRSSEQGAVSGTFFPQSDVTTDDRALSLLRSLLTYSMLAYDFALFRSDVDFDNRVDRTFRGVTNAIRRAGKCDVYADNHVYIASVSEYIVCLLWATRSQACVRTRVLLDDSFLPVMDTFHVPESDMAEKLRAYDIPKDASALTRKGFDISRCNSIRGCISFDIQACYEGSFFQNKPVTVQILSLQGGVLCRASSILKEYPKGRAAGVLLQSLRDYNVYICSLRISISVDNLANLQTSHITDGYKISIECGGDALVIPVVFLAGYLSSEAPDDTLPGFASQMRGDSFFVYH